MFDGGRFGLMFENDALVGLLRYGCRNNMGPVMSEADVLSFCNST